MYQYALFCRAIFIIYYMGNYRSAPQLTKLSIYEHKQNTTYAIKEMCGWRKYMEDTFIAQDQLPKYENCSLFAIFDGHGGAETAIFAANHFCKELISHPDFKKYQYSTCLKDTFFKIDEMMLTQNGRTQLQQIKAKQIEKGNAMPTKQAQKALESGSTALVCLITSNFIYVANAGDSRAICSISGKLVPLSKDHKTDDVDEIKRIKNAGGWIESGRVNGDLMVTRGLGDFPFKKNKHQKIQNQIVTANPDIIQIQKKNIDYILMGCDGIWQTKSSQQMKNWMDQQLTSNQMDKALQKLFDQVVSKEEKCEFGKDNMTAMIIKINNQE